MRKQSFPSILFLALFICTSTQNYSTNFLTQGPQKNLEQPAQNSLSNIHRDVLENLLSELQEQLQNIIYSVQQVEMTIAQKKIKLTRESAEHILQNLSAIKQIIEQLKHDGLKLATPEAITQASFLTAYIAIHLRDAFANIHNISVQSFFEMLQRTNKKLTPEMIQTIPLEKVSERITKNKKLVVKLIQDSENLGLTKGNIRWRNFESSKWTHRTLKALLYSAITCGGLWTIYQLYDPNTKIGSKTLWERFGFINYLYQNEADAQNKSDQEEMKILMSQISNTDSEEKKTLLWEGYNILQDNIALRSEQHGLDKTELTFRESTIKTTLKIFSPQNIIALLVSPYTPLWQSFTNKVGSIFSTRQDYDQLEKWTTKKYKKLLAWARGEIKYQYIGEEFNRSGETVTLNDIVGQEYLKELALELADFIKNPQKYERAHIRAEAGILLYGPPQVGKTMFAKALKTLLEQNISNDRISFIPVTNKDLEQFSIEDMFYLAGKSAPCVLFIDEIDQIGAKRSAAGGQKTRELLTSLNGLMTQNISKNVFVIGTTNKPEHLDFALTCKGRFGIQIPLTYPIQNDRVEYINKMLATRGVRHISKEFIQRLAYETEGHTYNDISSILNDAFTRAMRGLRMVTQNDFELAFDKQIRNIMPLTNVSDHEKNIIATYQIGLGLMRHILKTSIKTTCLTIRPVKQKIRYNEAAFSFTETNSNNNENEKLLPIKDDALTINGFTFTTGSHHATTFLSDEEIKHEIIVLLAGQAALKLLFGQKFSSYMPEHTAECLHKIKHVLSCGEKNSNEIIKCALQLKEKYMEEAIALLEPHKEAIEKLSQKLIEKEIIRSEEWKQLIQKIV